MSEEIKSKIMNEIMNHGFPLELEIASTFSRHSWHVEHNSYYIDMDEQKGREIDLVARMHRSFTDPVSHNSLEVQLSLVAEIKQANAKPWVIFTSPVTKFESLIGRQVHRNYVGFSVPYHQISRALKQAGHKNTLPRLGRTFYEALSKGRDDIFKALTGTTKAVRHIMESSGITDSEGSGDRLLYYYESVVILKGQLFECFLNEQGEPTLQEATHVQVAFNYLSPHYESTYGNVVDIVSAEHLPEFINAKQESLNKVFNTLRSVEPLNLSVSEQG
ncbi:hypothetical protein JZ785_27080 [Alicyclobacillus curvatus]|nr:hypothetical protein JZ785_27080 [Alicyclobacillus curvatus]